MIRKTAMPELLSQIESLCRSRRIWFDENHRFILYTPSQLKMVDVFVELQHALEGAASYLLATGDMERAFKYATMGLSIGQHVLRMPTRELRSHRTRSMRAVEETLQQLEAAGD